MFSPEFPRTRQNRTRQALAVLVASGALLLSGCGSDGKSEPTGTTIAVEQSKAPAAEGQFKTTMKFFPDGTAISTVEPSDDISGKTMTTHYSCPGDGPNLQVSSLVDSPEYGAAAGATQVIENSAICQDGQVTQSDFKLHEATQQPN
jgi:hypothetical protein